MKRPLDVEVTARAAGQIDAAEAWWRLNRPKAPNAIREELERVTQLLSLQPQLGARARNASLSGVRRLHVDRISYDVYYRIVTDPDRIQVLAFWHASRGTPPPLQ